MRWGKISGKTLLDVGLLLGVADEEEEEEVDDDKETERCAALWSVSRLLLKLCSTKRLSDLPTSDITSDNCCVAFNNLSRINEMI